MNPLKMLSGLGASTPVVTAPSQKAAPPVLSEEEKQARREKLSAAAQDRSQSWDRKLGQKKHSAGGTSPREGQALQQPQPEEAVSAETERAIQRAKAAERKIEKVSATTTAQSSRWPSGSHPNFYVSHFAGSGLQPFPPAHVLHLLLIKHHRRYCPQ